MQHQGELEKLGCKVVVVARGTVPSAKKWLEVNKFPYPLVLDLEMKMYRELGLKRSVAGVWNIPALIAYAEEFVAGKLDTNRYEGDDIHIMGGDFITDASGTLVLAYSSSNSRDRPSVDTILKTLGAES